MAMAGMYRVDGVRLAVEDLTARVSDLEGDTTGLAEERWRAFVRKLVDGGTAADGVELGRRLIGYRELSLMLVVELARAWTVAPSAVMETIGLWASTLGQ